MFMRIFIMLVIIVALIVGVLALILPGDLLVDLVVFRNFFDTALPILGVGALIKYLCGGCANCK